MEDQLVRIIDNQLYWHISKLTYWSKNLQARKIDPKKKQQQKDELTLNGVLDAFEIGPDGIVYDGNHRLENTHELLADGVTHAQADGRDLAWIPVHVNNPQTESEKWAIAFRKNGQAAHWDIPGLNDFSEDFADDLDLALINVATDPEDTLDDLLEAEVENEEGDSTDEADDTEGEDDTDESEDSEDANENKPEQKPAKKVREITCPNCSHVFTV